MDTLEKLAQKNKAHQKHLSNDRFSTVVMILVLVPFLFGIAIDVGLLIQPKILIFGYMD
jgi:hypothetical protein